MLDIFTGKCQKNEVSKNVFISLILTVIMNIIIKLADIFNSLLISHLQDHCQGHWLMGPIITADY